MYRSHLYLHLEKTLDQAANEGTHKHWLIVGDADRQQLVLMNQNWQKKGLLQTYLTLHDQVIEANSEKRQMQMAVHFVPLQAENDFGHLKVVEESHVFADLAKDVYLFETPAEFERLEKNCARFFAEFAPIMNQAVENYCKEHHDHEKTNSDDCNFQKKQSVSA